MERRNALSKTIQIPYGYDPRPYQENILNALDDGCRNACWVVHRRGGKDTTMWNYMIKRAYLEPGTYYYFLPSFAQAKRVVWDGMTNDGKRMLDYIPKAIIDGNPNNTEMKIWINGARGQSLIQLIGADSYDAIMGTNPRGVVFSEWSLMDPMAYDFVKPILAANGGWCAFIYCVKEGTLVLTDNGLRRIESVVKNSDEGFTSVDSKLYGLGGFHGATDFYNGGSQKLKRVITKRGYEISCTPNHQLWNGDRWVRSDELRVGDKVTIQRGQNVWGDGLDVTDWQRPSKRSSRNDIAEEDLCSLDMMYLLGLVLAEGCWSDVGNITVTSGDAQIGTFLLSKGFIQRDEFHYTRGSQELVAFMEWFGIKRGAENKVIPSRLFECDKLQVSAFLRGYFDGDGCADKRGNVHCDSVSEQLIKELQVVLLNYGITSTRSMHITKPTKKVKVYSLCHRLEINGYDAALYYDVIGFGLTRKMERRSYLSCKASEGRGDVVPVSKEFLDSYLPGLDEGAMKRQKGVTYRKIQSLLTRKHSDYLESLLRDNFYWDEVAAVEEDYGHVYDFVIPETHSFFSNGLISHNTPRGKNHGWDLAEIARKNPEDWFFEVLTVRDTGVLTSEQVESERRKGMPEDMIQQEFYCNFNRGQEGSYYGRQIEQLRKKNQITSVPFDTAVPVRTYWDLGIGDSTAIWFAQFVGKEIHLIHYYENSGEGLAHYVRVLDDFRRETGCVYDLNVAPHDIQARELGTGKTRLETARRLGLSFRVAPKLSLESGIEAVRMILSRCWFDEKGCEHGLKCLENYRKQYNEKFRVYGDKPFHDYTSHGCLHENALVHTSKGLVKIKDVSIGDFVITPLGKRKVLWAGKTKETQELMEITTSKGNKLLCTKEHKVFVQGKGFTRCDALRHNDVLSSVAGRAKWKILSKFYGMGLDTGFKAIFGYQKTIQESCTTDTYTAGMVFTTGEVVLKDSIPIAHYIGQYGHFIKARFLKVITCTTKIMTEGIIPSKTLSYVTLQNIQNTTEKSVSGLEAKITLDNSGNATTEQKNGIDPKKERNGIKLMGRKLGLTGNLVRKTVLFAKKLTRPFTQIEPSFALKNAKENTTESTILRKKSVFVRFAALISRFTNILQPERVVGLVPVQCQTTQNVYDLTVECDKCYYAQGFLVSNSDAFRMLAITESDFRPDRGVGDGDYDQMKQMWGWKV